MISLSEYIEEGLLGGYNEINGSGDPVKEIKQFIKANYYTKGRIQISKRPNENGKYEVSYDNVEVENKSITSLTNGIFEWGEIKGDFDCTNCKYLTSLEGAPKEVGGSFDCSTCYSLISLEGAPEKVDGNFLCRWCEKLTSLEGAPKEVGWNFECHGCPSLKSLKGAPKKIGGDFRCAYCETQWEIEDIEAISKIKGNVFL